MKYDVQLDLCFIRKRQGSFWTEIENELRTLFPHTFSWYLEEKQDGELEMVVAEIRGLASWETEEALFKDLEQKASDLFWTWVQGYRIHIYPQRKGCSTCGCS